MGRNTRRAAAAIALAAVLTVSAASPVFAAGLAASPPLSTAGAAAPASAPVPLPVGGTGVYVVLLAEPAVALYDGGEPGLAASAPRPGAAFDARSRAATAYAAFLAERQKAVAAELGVTPLAAYDTILNGFSAVLSPDQLAAATTHPGVLSVSHDEVRRPSGIPASSFAGRSDDAGAPAGSAGAGTVVGVVGSGIDPDNPSFAGDALTARSASDPAAPSLVAGTVVFDKADGTRFRSAVSDGDGWARSDLSTKLIAAHSFSTGAAHASVDLSHDTLSPRDVSGRGSHAAGVAAGDLGVAATVAGVAIGTVSGVAPAAKIAAYKACYAGSDPAALADDVCLLSDVLAAIDATVRDGVDVLVDTVDAPPAGASDDLEDTALAVAASAGVFVAVGAGDSGASGPGTARAAAAGYVTVAASTLPAAEGTVRMPDGWAAVGATVTVPEGRDITARVVLAADIALEGPDAANASLCYPGSIDPARAKGRIVVCDRGTNPRDEKAQVVADAGGVGMILVNVLPGSVAGEVYAVPTIHLDLKYRAALLAHVEGIADAVATLTGGNTTGMSAASPQIADFSARGGGEDASADAGALAPDLTAPGAGVLAASVASGGSSTFAFLSGTAVAAAHVAGAAALYLGTHPLAAPSEVASALATTATDTLGADGTANADPFAQGAGLVDPGRALDPGLVYGGGPASIVGTLGATLTVTRTLTATRPGTYTASADVPGVEVVVTPSTVAFDAAGRTATITIAFRRTSAPAGAWTTGALTWTGADGTVVRSPLAIEPGLDAPATAGGSGAGGSVEVSIEPGDDRPVGVSTSGLAPVRLVADDEHPVEGHTGDDTSGGSARTAVFALDVAEGATLAEVTLATSDPGGSDLDLAVYRLVGGGDDRYTEKWMPASGASDQTVRLFDPEPGAYRVVVILRSTSGPMTWDLTTAVVAPGGAGSLTASPGAPTADADGAARFGLSWTDLEPATHYVGVVSYEGSAARTVVRIDAGDAPPTAREAPAVSGTPEVGQALHATAGVWDADITPSFQWLRDGLAIDGATASDYVVTDDDLGTALSVLVTAAVDADVNTGTAVSNEVPVRHPSVVSLTMNRSVGSSEDAYAVTLEVRADGAIPAGTVTITVDGTEYAGTLASGAVVFPLRAQGAGIHVVVGRYAGDSAVAPSTGLTAFIVR